MYPLETLLLLGIITLLAGGLIGLAIGRAWGGPSQQKELEHRLSGTEKELKDYHENVSSHFAETAKKVGELTQSYRELHEHLAKGAIELTNTEIGREVIEAGGHSTATISLDKKTPIEPPRDWAPKSPGSHGMLSEEFGLGEHKAAKSATGAKNTQTGEPPAQPVKSKNEGHK